jgi:hypothetical protein
MTLLGILALAVPKRSSTPDNGRALLPPMG